MRGQIFDCEHKVSTIDPKEGKIGHNLFEDVLETVGEENQANE
jgi:hypothetical protein